jgi:hypothetical protein
VVRSLVSVLAGVAVVVSGSASAAGAGDPLAADAYRARANAICAQTATAIAALPPAQPPDFVTYFTRASRLMRAKATRLEHLAPPTALAVYHWRAVGLEQEQATVVRGLVARLPRAASARTAIRTALARLSSLDRRGANLWRNLGADHCARS